MQLYVGISSISVDQARQNLKQITGLDFDAIRAATQVLIEITFELINKQTWSDYLNVFEVEGEEDELIKVKKMCVRF